MPGEFGTWPMNPFDSPGFIVWTLGWALIILVAWQLRAVRRQKQREMLHKERIVAMEKGIPLPEIAATDEAPSLARWLRGNLHPRWALSLGVLLVFGGAGTALALFLSGEPYHRQVWSMGLIPIFLGAGFMLHYLLTRDPPARAR